MSRRDVVKGALAAGALAATGPAAPQETPEDAPDSAITVADIAAADRVTGQTHTDAERAQMARRLGQTRDALQAIRQVEVGPDTPPAAHFDPRLPGAPVPTGKSGARVSRGPQPRYDGNPESLAFASLVDLSRLIKARKISSLQLTQMYLARLKRFGPPLHCVVNLMETRALEQAARADREIAAGKYHGPLHGIPWGAKDLLATKGVPTTWGVRPYEHQMFDEDATIVQRLDAAGAVLIAKLSLGELAMGDVWFGGKTRSPWRPSEGSSGSSAGPGSAVAAGLVGFAIGSETLGSIVSPSVVNGVTGLRPTFGRVPRTGAMPLAWTMDKLGPMCRGVEDCALVLHAIHGPDDRDPTAADVPFRWEPDADLKKLRVGIETAAWERIAASNNTARRDLYRGVRDTLTQLGLELRPIALPERTPAYAALANTIIGVESAAAFAALARSGRLAELVQQEDDSWPNTFRVGATVPAADYLQALRVRTQLQHAMADALQNVDLYVTIPFAGPSLAYTNLTGHPTVVTRCGMLGGLPQMVEFIGGLYQEAAILRVARAYEQATPWHRGWPDTEKIGPAEAE